MRKFTVIVLVAILLILLSVQAAGASSCGFTHTVQRGENMFRIALRYGTTIQAVARANGISNPRIIYVGQRLYIPCGTKPPPSSGGRIHVVQYGQTLSSIARWYGTSVHAIVRANNIRNPSLIYSGQRLVIPSGHPPPPTRGTWYTVRRGDTLSGIAWRYGVNMWSIVQANNIRNPSLIYVGQRLYIP